MVAAPIESVEENFTVLGGYLSSPSAKEAPPTDDRLPTLAPRPTVAPASKPTRLPVTLVRQLWSESRAPDAFARNVVSTFGAQVLALLLGVAASAITARWLGAEGRGLMQLPLLAPATLGLLLGCGLALAYVHYLGAGRFDVPTLTATAVTFPSMAIFSGALVDVFLVNGLLGATSVGLHGVATRLAELAWYLPSAVGFAILPKAASTSGHDINRLTPRVLLVALSDTRAVPADRVVPLPTSGRHDEPNPTCGWRRLVAESRSGGNRTHAVSITLQAQNASEPPPAPGRS